MIDEMLNANELERMLRDSFANYVVQTALDYADPDTKARMIDAIRPILPTIRQTPHGRRIAGKLMSAEGQGRLSGISSGQITPNDATSPAQLPSSRQGSVGLSPQSVQYYNQNNFQSPARASHFGNQAFAGTPNGRSNLMTHDLANSHVEARGPMSDTSTAIFSPVTPTSAGKSPFDAFGAARNHNGFF